MILVVQPLWFGGMNESEVLTVLETFQMSYKNHIFFSEINKVIKGRAKMTVYEYLMGKADECNKKAQMFKKKGEKNLTVFFENYTNQDDLIIFLLLFHFLMKMEKHEF